MKPSVAVEKHREAVHALVRRFNLSNPRIVGAVGEVEGNEIELLVDDRPGTTLFDLGGLQIELEELFGTEVSVLTPGDVPEHMRTKLLKEALPL
ncbi:nucleotidyltransferase [Rhizobium sp. CC-YZS058]|uniref:nucleotidyltransferase family protein n=1 Tax=Rhizobium sp. CC-YZS058 TaxID=3042153 RepID=UPI002B0626C3|nr:nucleotidyltransferase [Rhizobium sp. CC-YZS058]MEA3535701.1 nucleotidyltransferase [Rhizobium sp. CC-YZS058]